MRILSVNIKNYKCFIDTGDIQLSRGINVIVGKNDSGKSAFLEALGLNFTDNPCRNLRTLPTRNAYLSEKSEVAISYLIDPLSFKKIISPLTNFWIRISEGSEGIADHTAIDLLTKHSKFTASWKGKIFVAGTWPDYVSIPSKNYFEFHNDAAPSGFAIRRGNTKTSDPTKGDLEKLVSMDVVKNTYSFKAERLNLASCDAEDRTELQGNASNLAEVLASLNSRNAARFQRLLNHLKDIFPHITNVSPFINKNRRAEISLWTVPFESERDDLAISLNDSGTGIGQVLAMLYVIVTADEPKIIVIDEPQSFLHPGAVRKLVEIFRYYNQHQYIISSHSPIAIDSSNNDCILLFHRVEGEDEVKIKNISQEDQSELRFFLNEVGVRLSDIFGVDKILWVEGQTEEACFPELIRSLGNTPLSGIQILGVVSTDELASNSSTKQKQTKRLYEIYQRISTGASLLPPAIAFILDTEGRNEEFRRDVDRASKGLVKWLSRRMYENYLLSDDAITAVLNGIRDGSNRKLEKDEIRNWIHTHCNVKKYFPASTVVPQLASKAWFREVHGASILKDVFAEFAGDGNDYDKVKHGLALTRYLIENPNDDIHEITNDLIEILKQKTVS